MWGDIAISFLLAFITAFVLTPYTMRLAKKVGAIDVPNDRRVNQKPMPRLGGIAVICGFIVSTIYLLIVMNFEKTINLFGEEQYILKLFGFLLGIIVLGVTCFIDDSKGIPSIVKLIMQIIAASIVVICGIRIENVSLPFMKEIWLKDWFSYILTIVWIVGITNAINLIDGLDRFIIRDYPYFVFVITNYIYFKSIITTYFNIINNSTSWCNYRIFAI